MAGIVVPGSVMVQGMHHLLEPVPMAEAVWVPGFAEVVVRDDREAPPLDAHVLVLPINADLTEFGLYQAGELVMVLVPEDSLRLHARFRDLSQQGLFAHGPMMWADFDPNKSDFCGVNLLLPSTFTRQILNARSSPISAAELSGAIISIEDGLDSVEDAPRGDIEERDRRIEEIATYARRIAGHTKRARRNREEELLDLDSLQDAMSELAGLLEAMMLIDEEEGMYPLIDRARTLMAKVS